MFTALLSCTEKCEWNVSVGMLCPELCSTDVHECSSALEQENVNGMRLGFGGDVTANDEAAFLCIDELSAGFALAL